MAYADDLKLGNIHENWAFKLSHSGSGHLNLAFADMTFLGVFYHGAILNKPSIRESINLSKSTAKSSNISITIADFTYEGSPVSELLFDGSVNFINQTVEVYSYITGAYDKIGTFRTENLSTDGDTITITMATKRPWDFISFPQAQSNNGIYSPIAYGSFTGNATNNFCTSKTLFPVPQDSYASENSYYLSPRTLDNGTGNETQLYYYESGLDRFIPVNDDSTVTTTVGSVYVVWMPMVMERTFKFRPIWSKDDNVFTNPDYAWNDNVTDYAYYSVAGSGGHSHGGVNYRLILDIPDLTGLCSALSLTVSGRSQILAPGNPPGEYVNLWFRSFGINSSIFTVTNTVLSPVPIDDSSAYVDYNLLSHYQDNGNVIDEFIAESNMQFFTGGSDWSGTNQVKDVKYTTTMDMTDPDSTASNKSNTQRKFLEGRHMYMACNGFTHGITGLTKYIDEIHHAHLDLLNRFTGLDVSTNPATDIVGWSELETSKNWGIRWWQLEPVELKKSLEKLQYEGGFIFRFDKDGKPQYIHLKDSNTADETLSKHDISNITIKPSPFSELLTKAVINYEKHPAEKRYMTSKTAYADTERTKWNIQTKENIAEINLDAYVSPAITEYDDSPLASSSSPNDNFFAYYYNIFGDIKLIVSATIVNPKYFELEVGQILAFDDMYPVKAFNKAWSGLKFMITSTARSIGTLKFEAREI